MHTIRIIPCLDVYQGRVVKGTKFKNLRDAGDPVELAEYYYQQGADELTFLDIAASFENKETVIDLIVKVAKKIFIPLTVGGGIRTLEDMNTILQSGADKVAVCTAALKDPTLLTAGAKRFGSQCIVLSIDCAKHNGDWYCYTHGGRNKTDILALEWAKKGQELGAGEILFNSIDCDGTKGGYDLDLLSKAHQSLSIPIIASGGAGELDHLLQAIKVGSADALLLASILHYRQYTIPQIKGYLQREGVPIRC